MTLDKIPLNFNMDDGSSNNNWNNFFCGEKQKSPTIVKPYFVKIKWLK